CSGSPEFLMNLARPFNRRIFRHRKQYFKCAALPQLAVDLDAALMASDDSEYGSQAEPTPLDLGCKERIENPSQGFLVHAFARIMHLKINVSARLQSIRRKRGSSIVLIDYLHAGSDRHRPHFSRRNGLGAVDDQVHNDLLYLAAI